MAKAFIKSELGADAELIWEAIRNFSAVGRWNPLAKTVNIQGDGIGCLRTVEIEGAGKFVERLDRIDDEERAYRYSIVESPLPMTNCEVELRVRDNGDGTSTVEWSSTFEATGNKELRSVRVFQQIYQDALSNLEATISGDRKG